ncbi:MAG: biotin synthase BioB [Deltaproteobacteria bacterium]|nr:MAG: biotin synthase BioB [Deltaproteobacteria bacterium]
MNHWQKVMQLVDRIITGQSPSHLQGVNILRSSGAEYTTYMAGAHHLKELIFGDTAQLCSIINAKSGRCQENCAFCAQSSHHQSSPPIYPLKSREEIVDGARQAQEEGSHCYGIVTSGTQPEAGKEFDTILSAIREIRDRFDIEPSASLGLLTEDLAHALADAGCVTYHHNLETARSFFPKICTTHNYEEDVQTVKLAKASGMKVCCGGIFGLGESDEQRVEMAETLRELDVDSVPLNFLNPVQGTPLEGYRALTPMDCVRAITMFRYFLPNKPISVCGGREINLRELQSWIFMAGASGTMVGNYLTTSGRDREIDMQMFTDIEVKAHGC